MFSPSSARTGLDSRGSSGRSSRVKLSTAVSISTPSRARPASSGASPRTNPRGHTFPAIGSVVAKHHGANQAGALPYVAFQRSKSHIAYAGYLGKEFDPFIAEGACKLPIYDLVGKDTGRKSPARMFQTAPGVSINRIAGRQKLLQQLDQARAQLNSESSELDLIV